MKDILDLHNFRSEYHFFEKELEERIDKFLTPFLNQSYNGRTNFRVKIIVGRGLNSTHFIEKKNPIKFFTEKYLDRLRLDWKYEGLDGFGNDGVILIDF
jgi:hypothetical protein